MINCVNTVTACSSNSITQYHDVFEGLGCLEEKHHIELDANISPVKHVATTPHTSSYKGMTKEQTRGDNKASDHHKST